VAACFDPSNSLPTIASSNILSDIVIPLTIHNWTLSSDDHVFTNLTARVPGDLLSDLMMNGIIDDPYIDRNFLTQREVWTGNVRGETNSDFDVVCDGEDGRDHGKFKKKSSQWKRTWVYSYTFNLTRQSFGEISWKLILEGIKMGADVFINDQKIGQVVDQFLRYDFEIGENVLQRGFPCGSDSRCHNLTISFDPSIHVNGRFTACSGGWDWSPYTKDRDSQQIRMFTLGIVKPVYIIGIGIQHFYISHVVPKVHYLGNYPTKPMIHAEGNFRLDVDVHLSFIEAESYSLIQISSIIVKTDFAAQIEVPVAFPSTTFDEHSTVVTISLTVPKENIELWWPNGMGKQPLYNIYIGTNHIHDVWIEKRIGFRTSALVTIDETNTVDFTEALRDSAEGSGQHGMYFRINGAIVMARGANFIPMDQLEGRLSSEAHKIAVQSASKANMNMLRVWGGGMVPLDTFYDSCDQEGILIYHDMMFVDEEGHYPVKTNTISKEIRHLVRSLASHPSLLVWNGCNECSVVMGTPSEIYANFVMKIVAEEDDTRPIWPSSPSRHGWKSGVRRLDSRPIGENVDLITWNPNAFSNNLESHGPYMRSFSYSHPGVNGIGVDFPYSNTPPTLNEVNIGHFYPNQFASEFGSSTMSSFESMTGTITPKHWSLHGGSDPDECIHDHGNFNKCDGTNIMAERNYPCDSHIKAYFGVEENKLSQIGEAAFSMQLYMCLIAQTLWMKGEIELRRSRNYFGAYVASSEVGPIPMSHLSIWHIVSL